MGSAVALIACSGLAAAAVVVRADRTRALLALGALLGAVLVLGAHVADADQVESLSVAAGAIAAAGVLGAVVVAGLTWLFIRVPAAFPVAAVATIPFRIPLSIGSSTASLLAPLYVVIAAGALAWALPLLRRRADPLEHAPAARPAALEVALAVVLVLYAAGSAWSADTDRALENVVFFYVPFAVLYLLLARLRWTPRVLNVCLGVLSGLAAALAVVGYVEYATRHLLLNPKVIASNQVEDYFRVNSLFFDPNIFGRFLAIVLVLLVAWMLWRRRERDVALAGLLAAVIFGGLVLTLSQSSFAALLAGLSVLGGLRWDPRRAALAAACGLLVAGIAFVAAADLSSSSSANDATSGRKALVEGGVRLAAERPLAGWGSGGFAREYRRAEGVSAERATSASHTIPVTVAAEQGLIGLAAFLALLWFAFRRLLRAAGSDAARAGIAAAFAALVVHSLLYAAFLEDPLTWALLGAGTALAATVAGPAAGEERDGGAGDPATGPAPPGDPAAEPA